MQTKEKANQTEGMFSRQAEQAWQVTAQPAMSGQQDLPNRGHVETMKRQRVPFRPAVRVARLGFSPKTKNVHAQSTPAILLWFQEPTMI